MAENPVYNLLDEPFIQVLKANGQPAEVSLIEIFTQASQMTRISGEIPTQSVALLRLCLAVLHRALVKRTPSDDEDLLDLIDDIHASWDAVVASDVVPYLQKHRDRFDLFHPITPFYQTAGMRTAKGEISELAKIVADVPNGNPFLTMRSARNLRSITAAEAARWVIHAQAFDPAGIKTGVVDHPRSKGGKVYPEGVAWTGQLGLTYLRGTTLRDTFLLNLWASRPQMQHLANDLPVWERPVQNLELSPDLIHRPSGPVDVYTWQPRRLLLHRVGDSTNVSGVLITYGDRFIIQERQDVLEFEPMSGWRHSKPQTAKYKTTTYMPFKREPGVALWRGMENLLASRQRRGENVPLQPGVLQHASYLDGCAALPNGLVHVASLDVTYGSNDSVVDEINEDTIDLPASVLSADALELRQTAVNAIEATRAGITALRNFAANLAEASGASRNDIDGPRERVTERAYAVLDPLYRNWLRDALTSSQDDPSVAEQNWHHTAHKALSQVGMELISQVSPKAWCAWDAEGARIDVGKADVFFRSGLAKAFPKANLTDSVGGTA